QRWNGAEWEELGDSAAVGIGDFEWYTAHTGVDVIVDAGDEPVVAWPNDSEHPDIEVVRWSGQAWTPLEDPTGVLVNAGASTHPSLALDREGHIALAWADASISNIEILVARWQDGAWVLLSDAEDRYGGASKTPGHSYAPRLGFDGRNRPWVAWMEAFA